MKAVIKAIILIVLIIVSTSCNVFAPKPTETPIPTETSLPTYTPTPMPTITFTPTLKPTKTPIPPTEPPSVPDLPMPTGKPLTSWEGFPIMPGALAGDGDGKSYAFTVKASPGEVQKFYEKETAKLGWKLLASGEGTTKALLLIFMKGSNTISVSVIPQADGSAFVMLVK